MRAEEKVSPQLSWSMLLCFCHCSTVSLRTSAVNQHISVWAHTKNSSQRRWDRPLFQDLAVQDAAVALEHIFTQTCPCHGWNKSFVHLHPLLLLLLFIAYTYDAGRQVDAAWFHISYCRLLPENTKFLWTEDRLKCWEGNPCSSPYGHRWLDKCERLTLCSSRGTQQSLAMPWGGAPPNLQRGREMATTQLFHSCIAIIFFLFKLRDISVALAVAMSGISFMWIG